MEALPVGTGPEPPVVIICRLSWPQWQFGDVSPTHCGRDPASCPSPMPLSAESLGVKHVPRTRYSARAYPRRSNLRGSPAPPPPPPPKQGAQAEHELCTCSSDARPTGQAGPLAITSAIPLETCSRSRRRLRASLRLNPSHWDVMLTPRLRFVPGAWPHTGLLGHQNPNGLLVTT